MNKDSWDDIKYVLTVAREGSLNAAAKAMGVTHATVMRRVAAFEARAGQTVFFKTASGYSVRPEAEAIVRAAQNVEDAVSSVDRAVHGSDQALSGTVRIASTDSLCQIVLPEIVQRIAESYPELSLSLLSANIHHDLSRLSADIAIRPAVRLEAGLVGKSVGAVVFKLYTSETDPDTWIAVKGPLKRSLPGQWMDENIPKEKVAHHADSFVVMRELSARGLGKAILPSYLGETDPRLQHSKTPFPEMSVPIWVASQEDIAQNARFRIVQDALCFELTRVFGTARTITYGDRPI